MTSPTDITDDLLIKLAGEGAFYRGLDYFESGHVLTWGKKGSTIRAEVAGSETYHVTLNHRGAYLEGSCNCPASDGVDFCKHCVAVALTYRQDNQQQAKLASGGPDDRIRAYLGKFSNAQLIDQLLDIISDDTLLTIQWSLKADAALGKIDDKALKKRITAALPYNRHLHHYSQVSAYFDQASPTFELLAEQIGTLPSDTALTLVDYGLQRLARALDTIDDSGGFRFATENILQTLHKQVVATLDWPPEKLANYLYEKSFGEYSDFYPAIPDDYADVVRKQVMSSYYQILQTHWDALPALTTKVDWDKRYRYIRLQNPLMEEARARKDFSAQLALLQKTATEERHFVELCSLCMEYDAWDQAELWLAKARKDQEKTARGRYRSYDVDRLRILLHLHKGETSRALDIQWDVFQSSLELQDYVYLLTLSDNTGQATDFQAKAKNYLRSKLDDKENMGFSPSYTSALMTIHLHENDLKAALALCEEREVQADQLLELARRHANRPATALPLYRRVIATHVKQANNRAYRYGIELLKELAQTLKVPAHHSAFAALIEDLRREFKPKRNFIKWLNEAFPTK